MNELATTTESAEARGFSGFLEPLEPAFFAEIVGEYGRSLCELAVERFGPVLELRGIEQLLSGPALTQHEPFWGPSTYHCLQGLREDDPLLIGRALGQILMNLAAAGTPCDWTLRLPSSTLLHWTTALYRGERFHVHSTGTRASITVEDASNSNTTLCERRDANDWAMNHSWRLPSVSPGLAPMLLIDEPDRAALALPRVDLPIKAPDAADARALDRTFSLLREYLPDCLLWVARAIRYLSLIDSPSGTMHSGSFDGCFGFMYMSAKDESLKIGEMFVHEASHQYFHVAARLGPLTEDDGRRFYSPFARTERPAERILLAYHAFANVELFYRKASSLGLSPELCQEAVAKLADDLAAVERILESEARLTPLGQALFLPLHASRARHD